VCLAAACIAGSSLAGCGRVDDGRAARAVTERFLAAIDRHDGDVACRQLTVGALEALEHDEGERCTEAVTGLDIAPSAVARAAVYGTGAKVDLTDGHAAFLELTPRGWRISAAGCRPEPGDRPYTCEVEA
jgi:hypothetical protein